MQNQPKYVHTIDINNTTGIAYNYCLNEYKALLNLMMLLLGLMQVNNLKYCNSCINATGRWTLFRYKFRDI